MGGPPGQITLILPLQGLRSNWQWSQVSSTYIVLPGGGDPHQTKPILPVQGLTSNWQWSQVSPTYIVLWGDSPCPVTCLVTGSVTGLVRGESPQPKQIDLTSTRSQIQLTVKLSILSWYSNGESPQSSDMFGHRFSHRSGHGGSPPPKKSILPLQGLRNNWQWSQESSPYIVLPWGDFPIWSPVWSQIQSQVQSWGESPSSRKLIFPLQGLRSNWQWSQVSSP